MSTWKKYSRIVYWVMKFIPVLVILVASTVSIDAQSPSPKLNPPPDYPNQQDGSSIAALPPLIGSGVIHINATAFNPQYSSTQYQLAGVGLANLSAGPATFLASLSLPNGVKIDQVVFVYYDNNASADISMDMDFQPFDYFGYGQMAAAVSSGADTNIRVAAVTDVYANVIYNETQTYLLTVTLPSGTDTYFISARIEYSYTAFAPAIFK